MNAFKSVLADITGAIGATPVVAWQKISAGTGGLVSRKSRVNSQYPDIRVEISVDYSLTDITTQRFDCR